MRTKEIPSNRRMKAPPIFSKPNLYASISSYKQNFLELFNLWQALIKYQIFAQTWQFNPPPFHHFWRSLSRVPFSSRERIPILRRSLIGEPGIAEIRSNPRTGTEDHYKIVFEFFDRKLLDKRTTTCDFGVRQIVAFKASFKNATCFYFTFLQTQSIVPAVKKPANLYKSLTFLSTSST